MKLGRSTVAVVALAIGMTAAAILFNNRLSVAQTTSSEATSRPAAQITPEAQALLQKVADAYRNLKSLEVAGTIGIDFDGGGQKKMERTDISGSSMTPNLFRHELKGINTIDSDGKKLVLYLNGKNTYLQYDSPKTRDDGLPMEIGDLTMDQNPSLLLSIVPDAAKVLSGDAKTISKSDDVTIDGKIYPTLMVVTEDQDTQVAIDPTTHLLRRMTHDLSRSYKQRGVPDVKLATITVDYTATTADAGQSADGTFNKRFDWVAPADAKPMSVAEMEGIDTAALAMEGKKAPDFSLKDIHGKTVSLADFKNQVVILDFWATYCVPCRIALPFVDQVARQRANDVKVFAIDTNEDLASAQTGQKEMNLSLPILLDDDGKVGASFMADHGIPETVIIGKDGVVRKVLIGENPKHPEEEVNVLNQEIDAANKMR